jgi:hypothetical protein
MVSLAILSLIADGTSVLDLSVAASPKPYLVGDLSQLQRYM